MGNTFSHLAACSGELSTSPQPGCLAQSQRLWAWWPTRLGVARSRAQRPWSAGRELQCGAVDGAKLNRSEIQRGVTVSIFMQTNQFTDQRSGDENQLALPFNLAVAADPAQVAVAGIERILQAGRIGARRGRVNRRRRYLAQRLMRPLVIELVAEVIEALLLGSERGGRRLGGFCLEGLVHAFMPPVLLGLARHNAHWGDAQLDPPHRQPAQAAGGQRGERRTIIGEQHLRQAALAKEPLKCAPAACIVGRDRTAAQQVTLKASGTGSGEQGASPVRKPPLQSTH